MKNEPAEPNDARLTDARIVHKAMQEDAASVIKALAKMIDQDRQIATRLDQELHKLKGHVHLADGRVAYPEAQYPRAFGGWQNTFARLASRFRGPPQINRGETAVQPGEFQMPSREPESETGRLGPPPNPPRRYDTFMGTRPASPEEVASIGQCRIAAEEPEKGENGEAP